MQNKGAQTSQNCHRLFMSRIYKFDGQKLHMICIYEAYVGNGLYIYIYNQKLFAEENNGSKVKVRILESQIYVKS